MINEKCLNIRCKSVFFNKILTMSKCLVEVYLIDYYAYFSHFC